MIGTRISALIVKELLAAFRDPKARVALIVFPLLQLFLFAFAATLEVSNVPLGVLNQDWGMESEQLISRFDRASAFSEVRRYQSLGAAQAAIDRQDIMVFVHIGQDFSRKLAAEEQPSVEILLDGRKSNSAQLVNDYIRTIISRFASDYRLGSDVPRATEIVDRTWYNPNRGYREAMVPTLIATLPMMMVFTIVGMSIAREREVGTFDQLLVSPLQPFEIVIGKAVPGLIVGLVQAAVISLIVTQVFQIKLYGSVFVLFIGMTVFLTAMIGIALFVSSLVSTQQQGIMCIMVVLMPAMLLSGFSSPVQNMPSWLQPVAMINPFTHILVIIRGLFLRDMPFWLVVERIWPMVVSAVVANSAAAWMFRRKVQ